MEKWDQTARPLNFILCFSLYRTLAKTVIYLFLSLSLPIPQCASLFQFLILMMPAKLFPPSLFHLSQHFDYSYTSKYHASNQTEMPVRSK